MASPQIGCNDAKLIAVAPMRRDKYGCRPVKSAAISIPCFFGSLSFPETSPFAIFAIGRSAGWLAHAQEQYRLPELIRPRARYVGDGPQTGVSYPIP